MIASPNELVYFVELAETLNFSRASERIGISQPSLTMAIKRLEHSIGVPLFNRSKTGVTLTPSGKRLLLHAKQLLQLWDTVKSQALSSSKEIQGCVTLGCHAAVATTTVQHFLPKLLLQYPKLEIKLHHDLSRKIAEKVINHSLDIGIVVNPVKHPEFIIQKLYDDTIRLWHSKKIKDPQKLLQNGDAVIICDPELMQTQWILKQMRKKGMQFQRMITTSSLELVAQLTASGAGIGIMPGGVAKMIGLDKLMMLDKCPVFHDEICLVYRHENRDIKAVQTVLEAIKKAHL